MFFIYFIVFVGGSLAFTSSSLEGKKNDCAKTEWQCRDGTCISFHRKCDGIVDCLDGSDETHPLCRELQCESNRFRCTYGACVNVTSPCNGIQECADNSDELLPKCRNEIYEFRRQFKCLDGQIISSSERCDGSVECTDGSDEILRSCAAKQCPGYGFQCAYGACVDQGTDCDGVQDCADNSDESKELCVKQPTTPKPSPQPLKCVLPAYPSHGNYSVDGNPNALPGQTYLFVSIKINCEPGFSIKNEGSSLYCDKGTWSKVMPTCARFCNLPKHPSVEYRCLRVGTDDIEGLSECGYIEPDGTKVVPVCRTNYHYFGTVPFMNCVNGTWDYIATCTAECGTITPGGAQLIIGGTSAKRGHLPWHAGIYRKSSTPYMQICGGSLISTSTVISAAHCFWSDINKLQTASNYAVAVGKLYRPWNNPNDADAQKSDVAQIKIPARFQGASANFQDDIAIVIVVTPFIYKVFIRPICIDFDDNFNRHQLRHGNMAKVAGWGITGINASASKVLKVVDVPYVKIEDCIALSPLDFREYITSDKICAGFTNGTALCRGDSGGGLAFPSEERGMERYYLRGIASTAPTSDYLCPTNTLTMFTQIMNHEQFIKENVV